MNNDLSMETQTSPRTNNVKIKVKDAHIVVRGTAENPYFGILYLKIGSNEYDEGYGSYELKNVFAWLDECFEIVEENTESLIDQWIDNWNEFLKFQIKDQRGNIIDKGLSYEEALMWTESSKSQFEMEEMKEDD